MGMVPRAWAATSQRMIRQWKSTIYKGWRTRPQGLFKVQAHNHHSGCVPMLWDLSEVEEQMAENFSQLHGVPDPVLEIPNRVRCCPPNPCLALVQRSLEYSHKVMAVGSSEEAGRLGKACTRRWFLLWALKGEEYIERLWRKVFLGRRISLCEQAEAWEYRATETGDEGLKDLNGFACHLRSLNFI